MNLQILHFLIALYLLQKLHFIHFNGLSVCPHLFQN